jgi:hypothetical protein
VETVVHGTAIARHAAKLLSFTLILACSGPNAAPTLSGNPYVTRAVLEAEPAGKLGLPGAEKLFTIGGERSNSVDGPQSSFTGAVWGSQSNLAGVYDFYRVELARLGWTEDGNAGLASGEYAGKQWCKPKMLFRLTFFDPARYERVGIKDGARFAIVFDAELQASIAACPRS